MAPKIVFVSDDVLFWARVHAAAKAAGSDAFRVSDEIGMESAFAAGGVTRVIVDLSVRSLDALAWAARWKRAAAPPQLVAYGSHVDEARLAAARGAGFDAVMANSQFHRTLSEWVR